jgi:hypothetical protein
VSLEYANHAPDRAYAPAKLTRFGGFYHLEGFLSGRVTVAGSLSQADVSAWGMKSGDLLLYFFEALEGFGVCSNFSFYQSNTGPANLTASPTHHHLSLEV